VSEPTTRLSREQIESYHETGFLRLERITSDGEIEELLDVYDRLFTTETSREERKELAATDEEGNETLPQVNGASEYAPELLETQYPPTRRGRGGTRGGRPRGARHGRDRV
jgi:hypothetical protein